MTDAQKDALIKALSDEFHRGGVVEARLDDEDYIWDGFHEPSTGIVVVDPVSGTVETLIHELIHRRFPRWGEKRVSETALRLVGHMSGDERRSWYQMFKRKALKCRKPIRMDE